MSSDVSGVAAVVGSARRETLASWSGQAADAFAVSVEATESGLSSAWQALSETSAVLSRFAAATETAQARSAAASSLAESAVSGPYTEAAAAAMLSEAAAEHAAAMAELDAAGHACAAALSELFPADQRTCPAPTPRPPSPPDHGRTGLAGLWDGAYASVESTIGLAYGTSLQLMVNPSAWWNEVRGLHDGIVYSTRHPGDAALAAVDWQGLQDNPWRWAGAFLPDIAITAATWGAGTAATTARRGAKVPEAFTVARAAETAVEVTARRERVFAALGRGRRSHARVVADEARLDEVFAALTEGGVRITIAHGGPAFEMPDGIIIARRTHSSDGHPAIDIIASDGSPNRKVHVQE
jgi:hypothetical protein